VRQASAAGMRAGLFFHDGLGAGVVIDVEGREITVGIELNLLGIHEMLGNVDGIGIFYFAGDEIGD
jgi:hypothetical protein